jgi:hypothetical protein
MKLGASTITAAYLGSVSVSAIYLGASQVFGGLTPFDPSSLFALSEPGVWYDPSDLTTMFTDTAGTTQAAVGQAVALVLDKSKGLVLGGELAASAAVSSNWSVITGSHTIAQDGVAVKVTCTSTGIAQVNLGTVAVGRYYAVSYQIRVDSGSAVPVSFTSITFGPGSFNATSTAFVSQSAYFSPTTANAVALRLTLDTGEVAYVQNISVKELPGNHATQSTTTARPILARIPEGGRRNLLTRTEEFNDAAWVKRGGSISANAVTAPDGASTADTFVENATTGVHDFYNTTGVAVPAGPCAASIYVKPRGRGFVRFQLAGSGSSNGAIFNLSTGEATSVTSGYSTTSTFDAVSGFWRLTLSATFAATNLFLSVVSSDGTGTSLVGLNAAAFDVWGAQVELGSTATAYQKVVSTYDVTEAGKADLYHLVFDGTDDGLVTPTITPGIDKVQVFAGVRKLSDAAGGRLVELSVTIDNNNGTFSFAAPPVTGGYRFFSKGTIATFASGAAVAPITNVVTGLGDISADRTTLRTNGTQVDQATADQGIGNYLAYPLHIGRRAGPQLPFNGHLYSLVVRFGANLDAGTISSTEGWVAGKTGVVLP